MADVSHELGSLRFVVDSPLSSKVAMFNNQAQKRQNAQLLNPFSSSNDGRTSPKPTFSKDEYGKPLAGSLTEMRGQKANMHVLREMLELCQIIDSEGYKVNDEPSMRVIPFGELFNIYNYISDKVVGILLRARKYKYVQFEGEMLFQRRDDDVPVFLLRPIKDIRQEINSKIDDIKRAASPAPPQATSLLLDKGSHQQKLQEAALSVAGGTSKSRSMKSRSASPATSRASSNAGSKAPTPTREVTSTSTSPNAELPPLHPPTHVEVKSEETVSEALVNSEEVQSEAATAVNQATNVESTETPENASTAAAGTVVPTSVETSSANIVDSVQSFSGSECNITINDLPTIVIETTAVYIQGEQGASQSTENGAEVAAVTLEPTNLT